MWDGKIKRFYEALRLDTNIVSTHSKISSIGTANALMMLVNLDLNKNDLSMDVYYTSFNKHYRGLMAVLQRAAITPADLMEKYADGKLISKAKNIN